MGYSKKIKGSNGWFKEKLKKRGKKRTKDVTRHISRRGKPRATNSKQKQGGQRIKGRGKK